MDHARRAFLAVAGGTLLGAAPLRWAAGGEPDEKASNSLVESARYVGSQFLNNPVGVTGADGATSILLPNGQSLWVFGDTLVKPFKSIHEVELKLLPSNTAALVLNHDIARGIEQFRFLSDAEGSRPRQLIPFAEDEDPAIHRVWGVHGVCVGKHLYVYYHRISLLKDVDVFLNFRLDGMGIARAEMGSFDFKRLIAEDDTREYWKGDQPGFGVFVERAKDYIYLWGSLETGMFLARTRPNTIEDLASYEYLVEAPTLSYPNRSSRWANTFEATAPLFDSVPNEMSAAYNPYLQKHVAIHSFHRENKIVMRTAPEISGPWSDGEVVYRPDREAENDFIYAAKEHPELARDGGRIIYVTFVNSRTYIPQLVELTLR